MRSSSYHNINSGLSKNTNSQFTTRESGSTLQQQTPKTTRFYQKCSFWACIIMIVIVFFWVDAVANNEGCPEVKVMDNFQIDQFFGRWYQMYRMEQSTIPGQTGDCVMSELTLRSDYLIKIDNSGVGPDGVRKTVSGRARWSNVPFGELDVKYGAFAPWQDYKILETDYVGYAIIHSCSVTMGAWTREDTQLMVRFASEQGDPMWTRQSKVLKGAIKDVFTVKSQGKARAKLDDFFEPVIQGKNCTYPQEPQFENPQPDNSNDHSSFNI